MRGLERFRPFTVKVDITREELDRYLAHQMDLPGVDVQATPHRNYRYAGLGGHLIGYMNEVRADEQKRLNEELQQSESPQGPYLLGDYVDGAASSAASSASCAASTARSASRSTPRAGARTTPTASSRRTSGWCRASRART